MASNALQGRKFQDDFEARWAALGKWGWLYRFEDAADLYGLNKKKLVLTSAKPADYVVGYKGLVALVEVKSTIDPKGFTTSMLRQSQRQALLKSCLANTPHYIIVRAEKTQDIFCFPAPFIRASQGVVAWATSQQYLWKDDQPCPFTPM